MCLVETFTERQYSDSKLWSTETRKLEFSSRGHFKSPMTSSGHDFGDLSCFQVPDDADMTKTHGSPIHYTRYRGYLVTTC